MNSAVPRHDPIIQIAATDNHQKLKHSVLPKPLMDEMATKTQRRLLDDAVCVVTGSNSGIGGPLTQTLAPHCDVMSIRLYTFQSSSAFRIRKNFLTLKDIELLHKFAYCEPLQTFDES